MINFQSRTACFFSKQWNKLKDMMFDMVKNKFNSGNKFLAKYVRHVYKDIVFHSKTGNVRSNVSPYYGICIMGEKIYVDVRGNFFLCEKVGCKFSFDNVDTGIDFEKVVKIFRKYRDKACDK